MGLFTDLIRQMLKDNNIDDARTLQALEDEGEALAEEIAANHEQIEERRKQFVQRVDVSPVDFEKFEEKAKNAQTAKREEKE